MPATAMQIESGNGGPASGASLMNPQGVSFDNSGNLYIADSPYVRKVTATTGIITNAAGSSTQGYSGDGGKATSAQFNGVWGPGFDGFGNFYIADEGNNRHPRGDGHHGHYFHRCRQRPERRHGKLWRG